MILSTEGYKQFTGLDYCFPQDSELEVYLPLVSSFPTKIHSGADAVWSYP